MKIGFSMTYGNPISETIVFFTKSTAEVRPYVSHCFSILGEMNGIEIAMSADEIMSNLVDVARYKTKGHALRIYELPDVVSPEERTSKIIKLQNQKFYPHLELLWFVYRWLRRKFNPQWKGHNWLNYGSFCSEGVLKIDLMQCGYAEYFKGIDPNVTDATELESILRKIPNVKLIFSQDFGK